MSLRLRLLLLVLLIGSAGGYLLTRQALEQVRPRYLESMEETLIDTSVLLASVLEMQVQEGRLTASGLGTALDSAHQRRFEAQVFSLTKTRVDLRVYVTDAEGRVVYDSAGTEMGRDYSRWNDVRRTLDGRYGARSTRTVAGDDDTQVLHVAAPIRHDGRIIGVVSVGKPTRGVNELVAVAKRRILYGAVGGGFVLLLVLSLAASWAIAPLERLTGYARAVRDGRPQALPTLPGRTLRELGQAFEQMRDALEGRHHVERYTQALAHELKAPLAAIRGAAELLDEAMPVEQRQKFIRNIRQEAARIQLMVDRLLELSSLEARKTLRKTERFTAADVMSDAANAVDSAFAARAVQLEVEAEPGPAIALAGERVLVREALVNLLQNALEFSPQNGRVTFRGRSAPGAVEFVVNDDGPGVPDYALPRVFERFYSLPRPGTGRKSTGIGLALVQEVAHLHGGSATLANRAAGGATAILVLPAFRPV